MNWTCREILYWGLGANHLASRTSKCTAANDSFTRAKHSPRKMAALSACSSWSKLTFSSAISVSRSSGKPMEEYSWNAAVPGKTLAKQINIPQQFRGGSRTCRYHRATAKSAYAVSKLAPNSITDRIPQSTTKTFLSHKPLLVLVPEVDVTRQTLTSCRQGWKRPC